MIAGQQLETYILLSNIRAQYLVQLEFALKGIFLLCPQKRSGTQYCLLCNHTGPCSEGRQTEIPPLL